jgi:hypothetical protein
LPWFFTVLDGNSHDLRTVQAFAQARAWAWDLQFLALAQWQHHHGGMRASGGIFRDPAPLLRSLDLDSVLDI